MMDTKQNERLLERVDVPEGWAVHWDDDTLTFDYRAVPLHRLQRRSWPGIDSNYIGEMWMLASHDSIGHGLNIEHQGIINHGKTVDCQHLDDAVAAVEHGFARIELAVGEELDDGHTVKQWPRM